MIFLMLFFKLYVTVDLYISFWKPGKINTKSWFWTNVASLILQLIMCLMFTYYFEKMKEFYSQPKSQEP